MLDQADGAIRILNPEGRLVRSFGRFGEGPGEFEGPYAIAASGSNMAVWDQNGRTTVFGSNGQLMGVHTFEWGDSRALRQRLPLTRWEEPFQLSREDVARRLQSLDDGTFALQLQEADERFDPRVALRGDSPTRYDHHVMRFDSMGVVVDTVLTLLGGEIGIGQPATDVTYALGQERPFPFRPAWAAGDGWIAFGSTADPQLTVRFSDGSGRAIRWPRDERPIQRSDFEEYVLWEIEAYGRTKGDRWREQAERIDRDVWIDELVSFQGDLARPQFSAIYAAGECLAISGFRPEDGPHADSYSMLVLNLHTPVRWEVVELPHDASFVREVSANTIWTLTVEETGVRTLRELGLPTGLCD
jgi:hypothetical protein